MGIIILLWALGLFLLICLLKLIFRRRIKPEAFRYGNEYRQDLRFPNNNTYFQDNSTRDQDFNDRAVRIRKQAHDAAEVHRRFTKQVQDQNERTRKINEDIRKRGDLVRMQQDGLSRAFQNRMKSNRGW